MKLNITMATLATLCLLYAVFAPSVTAADCPSGWTPGGERCFKFFTEELTWSEAEGRCVRNRGHLASIHSQEEQDTVNNISRDEIKSWIGGVGNQMPGNTYSWTDGTEIDYKNWAAHEPNNSGENEHCMDNDHSKGGKWNDDTCHKKLPYVCVM